MFGGVGLILDLTKTLSPKQLSACQRGFVRLKGQACFMCVDGKWLSW